MSFPFDGDPEPQLTTTRIGGGGRAWLIALGAVVLLGSVVYLGLSGQSPSVGASPSPGSSGFQVAIAPPTLPPEVESVRVNSAAPDVYQYLGTALTLDNRGTLAILDIVGQNEYEGIYRIPYSLVQPTAGLELDTVTASISHDESDPLGEWRLPLNLLAPGAPSRVVLNESVGPQDVALADPDFQELANNGYNLKVTTQGAPDSGVMTIDVTVNPDLETYGIKIGGNTAPPAVLDHVRPTMWEAQIPVQSGMLGTRPHVLISVENGITEFGGWSLKIPADPQTGTLSQLHVHQAGEPAATNPAILHDGFDLSVTEVLEQGQLHLDVVLTVATPSQSP